MRIIVKYYMDGILHNMKYYFAAQRRIDDKWEFSVDDGSLAHPVGYCVGYPDLDDPEFITLLGTKESPAYIYYRQFVEAHKHAYHRDGHGTREEAVACYLGYLLDNRLTLNHPLKVDSICKVCGVTTWYASVVDGRRFDLCDEHRNRTQIEYLMRPGFESHRS